MYYKNKNEIILWSLEWQQDNKFGFIINIRVLELCTWVLQYLKIGSNTRVPGKSILDIGHTTPVVSLEWGLTAWNSIAQQLIGWHFWQEINCSTQNLSTARIQLILAQPYFFVICSNGVKQLKNCVDQFLEPLNFEQLIMSLSQS